MVRLAKWIKLRVSWSKSVKDRGNESLTYLRTKIKSPKSNQSITSLNPGPILISRIMLLMTSVNGRMIVWIINSKNLNVSTYLRLWLL